MSAADHKRVERALAGAFARVDALWSRDAFGAMVAGNPGGRAPAMLRELLTNELALESDLRIYPERFESLCEAVRMSA